MKKLLTLFSFLFAFVCHAQTAVITGQVIDSNAVPWGFATITATFMPAPNVLGPYTWSGGALAVNQPPVVADGSGNFSITLPNNLNIVPALSQWQLNVCPLSTQSCAIITVAAVANFNVTNQLTAAIPVSRIAPANIPKVYTTTQTQTNSTTGGLVFDLGAQCFKGWNGTSWSCINGSTGPGINLTTNPGSNTAALTGANLNIPPLPTYNVTSTGTSGAATISGTTINVPQYSPNGQAITPITISNILYVDQFPGSTIDQKVANAFASVAGTSSNPTASAAIICAPNQTYNYSVPITIPNKTTYPYIRYVLFNCNGDILNYTGTDSGSGFLIHGQNEDNANSSLLIENVQLSRTSNNGPDMINNGRMGVTLRNVAFYNGLDSYQPISTTSDGGPGYIEQTYMDNVSFTNPARDGIHWINGAGGDQGYQYNYGQHLRFVFNGDGHTELNFGSANAFNGSYQTTVNTGGTGVTYVIKSTGNVLSTRIEFNGEGSTALAFGGGGILDMECHQLARMAVLYDFKAWCHNAVMPVGSGTGLYGVMIGSATHSLEEGTDNGADSSMTVDDGTNWVRFHGIRAGLNTGGNDQIVTCSTDLTHPNAWDSTYCLNTLFHNGSGYIGLGPGFHDNFTTQYTAQYILDVKGNGINSVNYSSNGQAGLTCTGTPTSSFASVNGIVTHC